MGEAAGRMPLIRLSPPWLYHTNTSLLFSQNKKQKHSFLETQGVIFFSPCKQ